MWAIVHIFVLLLVQSRSNAVPQNHVKIHNNYSVLAEIITKYLIKWDDTIFVSIILNPQRKNQDSVDNFLNEFFKNPSTSEIPLNILNELSQSTAGNRNAFNLVPLEDPEYLVLVFFLNANFYISI